MSISPSLLQDELKQAQLIQQKMQPKPFTHANIDCLQQNWPAHLLSGDCVDYFALSEHQVAFYLGDVSGCGPSAAMVGQWFKGLMQGLRCAADPRLMQPKPLFELLDHEIKQLDLSKKFLTLFYAVLDTDSLQLNYAVAGHLPMPILYHQNQASYLEGQAMPLGLFTPARFNAYNCQLPNNFALLLFSDGILERMDNGPMLDKETQLLSLVTSVAGDVEKLANKLGLANADNLLDDTSMLAISRSSV